MSDQRFDDFKRDHINYVQSFMKRNGEMGSLITVLAEQYQDRPAVDEENDPDKEKSIVIHIPVPNNFLRSGETKEEFVNEVIPSIFEDIKKKFIPKAVVWTSEAWMREASNEQYKNADNYTDLPITGEVMILSFTKADYEETIIFRITRKGKIVNAEGEMVDDVELTEDHKLSSTAEDEDKGKGRFTNLFSKFNL